MLYMKLPHTISQATGPSVSCKDTSFTVTASNLLPTEDFIFSSLQCCVKTVFGTFIFKVFVSPFFAHFHVIIYNKQSKKDVRVQQRDTEIEQFLVSYRN
jgi:hypothetical protein